MPEDLLKLVDNITTWQHQMRETNSQGKKMELLARSTYIKGAKGYFCPLQGLVPRI